jgi:hypothetical protein
MVTPSQMKVWLEILHRLPTTAPFGFRQRPDFDIVADLAPVQVCKGVNLDPWPSFTSGAIR